MFYLNVGVLEGIRIPRSDAMKPLGNFPLMSGYKRLFSPKGWKTSKYKELGKN